TKSTSFRSRGCDGPRGEASRRRVGQARRGHRSQERLAILSAHEVFSDVHRKMHENRPIHWPLSSEKKTFVAWITIHRWDGQTLRALLAEHLHAAQLDGELTDLRAARDGADKKAARAVERRFENVLKWREELSAFIAL